MKAQKTVKEKTKQMIRYSPQHSFENDYPDKRQQEMKRRFGILQTRRSYLERELKVVKNCLFTLDKQMQSYSAYKQLSTQSPENSTF